MTSVERVLERTSGLIAFRGKLRPERSQEAVEVQTTVLFRRGSTLVRRLRLEPGEAMPWHKDPFQRVTVVLSGDALEIEYQDGANGQRFELVAGRTDWEEPFERLHRAVNVGAIPYEEVTVFFLDRPDDDPQPNG